MSSRKTDPKALLREEILLSVCKDLDEATFLIFFDVTFLPKGELGKWIEESADIRKFDAVMESPRWQKRFPEVSDATITKVLALYQKSINQSEKKDKYISSKIAHTLEKIELL